MGQRMFQHQQYKSPYILLSLWKAANFGGDFKNFYIIQFYKGQKDPINAFFFSADETAMFLVIPFYRGRTCL